MLRLTIRRVFNGRIMREELLRQPSRWSVYIQRAGVTKMPFDHGETDEEFDTRMECYFSRHEIDGWELRKGLNDLAGIDAVPDPRVVVAALYAARRVNDYAATTRLLEMVKMKCGPQVKKIWPYMLQELEPAMTELGVDSPERLGYGRPELALVDVHDVNIIN